MGSQRVRHNWVTKHTDVVVQSLSHVWLLATPWTTVRQASLSFSISRSLLKLMSVELVMPSNYFLLCCPHLFLRSVFPSITVFSKELALHINGASASASASTSVLPVNVQGWFPLGWTGLISLQCQGLSRVFSATVGKHHFLPFSLLFGSFLTSVHDYLNKHIALAIQIFLLAK